MGYHAFSPLSKTKGRNHNPPKSKSFKPGFFVRLSLFHLTLGLVERTCMYGKIELQKDRLRSSVCADRTSLHALPWQEFVGLLRWRRIAGTAM